MKTIAFLTSYGGQLFNPETEADSIAGAFGSELALYETCKRLGIYYNISVFIHKPKGYFFNRWNVNWRSSFDWETFDAPDIVIVCRYMNIFLDYNLDKKSKIFVWAHDPCFIAHWNGTQIGDYLVKNVEPFVHKWINVGEAQFVEKLAPRYKLSLYKGGDMVGSGNYVDSKTTQEKSYCVIRNGITLEPNFNPIELPRQPMSFVWCSCPTRGLWFLLEKWSMIKTHFPTATLTIYYTKSQESAERFRKYENDKSITYIGKVSQKVLFEKLKNTEYWLYCSSFESCCTTAIEMAYYGPIAIAAPQGGLRENVVTEGLIEETNVDIWYEKAMSLIHKLEDSPSLKREFRQKQFDWALEQTWDHRIPLWREILEN